MSPPTQSAVRNRLLRRMSPDDFALLAPHFEFMQLAEGAVIVYPDQPIEHVYFLDSGVGSIVVVSPAGQEAEAALFGREAMAPTSLILGADRTPHRIVIQIKDDAWRIARQPFLSAVDASASLRGLLMLYVEALAVQTAYTALSNAVHPIDQRLARWLLMCDDRMDGRDMPLTHEFLGIMLAVRRSSVTNSLHVLEGEGLIRARRGSITVINRTALERFAGDAYGITEAAYARLLGSAI